MKKSILLLLLLSFIGLSAYGAKYKVNTGGKVTSETGQVQNSGNTVKNVINNFQASPYVASRQANKEGVGIINIVMDYSGSMYDRIQAAQMYMTAIVQQLPSNTKIGFRVFGHDGGNNPYTPVLGKVKNVIQKKDGKYKVQTAKSSYLGSTSGSCSATSQVAKVETSNPSALYNGMRSVGIGGSTPLTLALEQAVNNDFLGMDNTTPKKIILITDGGENCGGDPCAFAKNLMAKRKDIIIDVVLVSSYSRSLTCVSSLTGGKFYNPIDVPSFMNVLSESMQEPADNVPVPQENKQPDQQYEFIKD